jgi:hypothetical protein
MMKVKYSPPKTARGFWPRKRKLALGLSGIVERTCYIKPDLAAI